MTFPVGLTFQGKLLTLPEVTTETTANELHSMVLETLGLNPDEETSTLKILFKGKRLQGDVVVFSTIPKKLPKLMVLATSKVVLKELSQKRSDPTIRGMDEAKQTPSQQPQHWGDLTQPDKNFKFCRLQACTWQSFGHRPTDATPHAFQALRLLEKLSTDPGVVAVLQERELVVGTLGEMDPIDDRIMQTKAQEGACLLGYNTNAGARIDIKLRTDDLTAFRPYHQLVSTLIHELSHNWVGEHNLLFWTNYGQMMAEYLTRHYQLRSTLVLGGKTTSDLAEITWPSHSMADRILTDLVPEMAQHGLHPRMIEAPIRQRCQELEQHLQGHKLGGTANGQTNTGMTARERALAAAEQRRRLQDGSDESPDGSKG